tara:strand:- start:59 stop:646 length:588 start_codon:yes stop_codon:yes gene_type:complete
MIRLIDLLKEINEGVNDNLDPLKPQNNEEKLLSSPKKVKDNKGNTITLIGQESKSIYWDNNGDRWTSMGNTYTKYEMNRYEYIEYIKQPKLEPEIINKAWEKAYNEHTDSLKIFVNDILEVPYDVNLGWRDGQEVNIIYITSKIYGKNPTTFTTYHKNTNGDQIDYKYESYKPINASSDEIEDALTKRKLKKLGL